ncbi:uncharacterized protein F4822DRAFT_423605 [Hypoxylon trugodes]|uniref:uncharacterized protein n=1 Tax=Hypoxylon trugodes TaxID=326681 RepID=UPI00219E64F2|nr:uncharacterized protein F4822DRAFT_423605 [Hypoxylon trugodes]KAI1393142.1 hypothetical protein F4822DRAFT_423605 [Hypoxylon trugodes]
MADQQDKYRDSNHMVEMGDSRPDRSPLLTQDDIKSESSDDIDIKTEYEESPRKRSSPDSDDGQGPRKRRCMTPGSSVCSDSADPDDLEIYDHCSFKTTLDIDPNDASHDDGLGKAIDQVSNSTPERRRTVQSPPSLHLSNVIDIFAQNPLTFGSRLSPWLTHKVVDALDPALPKAVRDAAMLLLLTEYHDEIDDTGFFQFVKLQAAYKEFYAPSHDAHEPIPRLFLEVLRAIAVGVEDARDEIYKMVPSLNPEYGSKNANGTDHMERPWSWDCAQMTVGVVCDFDDDPKKWHEYQLGLTAEFGHPFTHPLARHDPSLTTLRPFYSVYADLKKFWNVHIQHAHWTTDIEGYCSSLEIVEVDGEEVLKVHQLPTKKDEAPASHTNHPEMEKKLRFRKLLKMEGIEDPEIISAAVRCFDKCMNAGDSELDS